MYTLIQYPLCPHSRSIRLALAECGTEARLEEERPWEWRPEFLEMNPAGTLPVLRNDDEDPLTLCGAYAISEYLSETAADGAGANRAFAFFPGDEEDRAEVRRLVDWFHRKFHDEVTAYLLEEKVVRRFARSTSSGGPDMAQVRAGQANLRYHLRYIGHLMQERHWLAGEALSFADLAAAAQLSCIDYLGDVPWEEDEDAKGWYARIKSRPSFRAILADRLPGMAPPEHYADPDF